VNGSALNFAQKYGSPGYEQICGDSFLEKENSNGDNYHRRVHKLRGLRAGMSEYGHL
jgi:hypothetical protein